MWNAINVESIALAKKSRESMSLKNLIKQSWGSDLFSGNQSGRRAAKTQELGVAVLDLRPLVTSVRSC